MDEQKIPQKKGKVVFRRAPNALKIVLILLIVFSMAALIGLRWVHNGIQQQIQEKKEEAAAVEHANDELTDKIEDVNSVQGIQDIARDELGLVDPDTILIDPQ